ncbi:TetR/AcrR family transcriptional regulator [Saccharomonospora azurea]|uniref:Transcriptional regulator n=1 Tax=Saccharomonospora azurea NA-128 TaxID=882081 RepID=H8G414_9PSEU|nr:TetR/AcrR family transcriptional regulator [Saccharomonospora azurea]EHY90143.1 transcriptional regulator [Saccharomonospora azurea NA-128]
MGTEQLSLRERKKRQTRENISRHASRLFMQRGFDNVTIAEIADAAGVSKMTVTNYFPRKEDLAWALNERFADMPANAVRARRPGESALAAVRAAYLTQVAERDPMAGFAGREFAQMVADSPVLVSRLRHFHDYRQASLRDTLAEETDAAPDDVLHKVVAATLTSLLRVLFDDTVRLILDGLELDAVAEQLSRDAEIAFDALEPAFGQYAVRAPQ